MVAFRYEHWDEDLLKKLRNLASLTALFHHLLLQANGDAERALRNMQELQEMGYIDPEADLEQFRQSLQENKIITEDGGKASLTKRGERFVRTEALRQVFTSLKKGDLGGHRTPLAGEGGERLPETRPWEFGDDLAGLDVQQTLKNSLLRTGANLQLAEEDLEINETEHHSSCATVLMVDISHSMILYGEDRITPAKKVAIAMAELIRREYSKDSLSVVLFGDDAVEVKVEELSRIGAGPYHTNTRAGLQLAQRILRRKKHPNKQIFMITDGKASAMYDGGTLYKNPFGLDPRIVNKTLEEAAICRRNKIVITTFMLTDDAYLVDFVNKLTKVNRGRAIFTGSDNIGKSVLVDYIKNRKRKV